MASGNTDAGELQAEATRLAGLIGAHAPYDGPFELALPGVQAIRVSRPTAEQVHNLQRPALCLVAQGAKSVTVGHEVYDYDPTRLIVFAVDLPVASRVVQASSSEPYLCLRLDLDPQRLSELVLKVFPHGLPPVSQHRAVTVAPMERGILDAASRLIELVPQPRDVELLAPLVLDEILIRLLRSPIGLRVAQIGQSDSATGRIARAVTWLRDNYTHAMSVEELAALVHMSPSSFHRQFKSVTSMSPLQYQKVLRLQEARRLMLTTLIDAGSAGRLVGYLSPSQFSREYSRFFGSSPTRDIARLRDRGLEEAAVPT